MSKNADKGQQPEIVYDSFFELLTHRLYWFYIGPMFLILMLLGVFNDEDDRRLGYNVAYLVGLALLPMSRWLEMRSGKGLTAECKPATWEHFRRYTWGALTIGIALLIAVNLWVTVFHAASASASRLV